MAIYSAMKSESSCGALCQHPECWRANLRRVKDAVKLRNGIHSHEILERKDFESLEERSCQNEDGKQVRSP